MMGYKRFFMGTVKLFTDKFWRVINFYKSHLQMRIISQMCQKIASFDFRKSLKLKTTFWHSRNNFLRRKKNPIHIVHIFLLTVWYDGCEMSQPPLPVSDGLTTSPSSSNIWRQREAQSHKGCRPKRMPHWERH